MRLPRLSGPRSLVRRFSVLVLGVGLVSLAIQFLVLRLWTEPLFEDHAQALASQVRVIHTALRQTAPADRPALAQALSRGPVTVARRAPEGLFDDGPLPLGSEAAPPTAPTTTAAAQPPGRRPATLFAERLAEVLGAVKLHDGRPGSLVFELPIDGDIWWLSLRAPVPPQALVDTAVLWLALLGLTALLATVFGLRWIAQPVRTLARQLGQQRGALRPLAEDPQASTEIRALVSAFNELVHGNAMAASLRQQLLAGVSHDLRTPLARLRLRIETQCEPPLSDALEADLRALQHIVDQFLAYVQGDTGLRLGRERPIVQVLQELAESYAGQGLDVAAEVNLPAALPPGATAWPQWPDLALRRLLENLVNNALAHGHAPVRLVFGIDGEHWCLAVEDQGAGVGAADFQRARQPFVRLNEARSELGHCGLGLAIVDQIAQQLGARLEARPRTAAAPFAVVLRWPLATGTPPTPT